MENDNQIKIEIDDLYNKLSKNAATFIYNPTIIKDIRNKIFELQNKCNHNFQNGVCIYCRKEEKNAD